MFLAVLARSLGKASGRALGGRAAGGGSVVASLVFVALAALLALLVTHCVVSIREPFADFAVTEKPIPAQPSGVSTSTLVNGNKLDMQYVQRGNLITTVTTDIYDANGDAAGVTGGASTSGSDEVEDAGLSDSCKAAEAYLLDAVTSARTKDRYFAACDDDSCPELELPAGFPSRWDADTALESTGEMVAAHDHRFQRAAIGRSIADLDHDKVLKAPTEDERCRFVKLKLPDTYDKYVFMNDNRLLTHPDADKANVCYMPLRSANVSYDARGCSLSNHHVYTAEWADVVTGVRPGLHTAVDADMYRPMCEVEFRADAAPERVAAYLQFLYNANPEREFWRENMQGLFQNYFREAEAMAAQMREIVIKQEEIRGLETDNAGLERDGACLDARRSAYMANLAGACNYITDFVTGGASPDPPCVTAATSESKRQIALTHAMADACASNPYTAHLVGDLRPGDVDRHFQRYVDLNPSTRWPAYSNMLAGDADIVAVWNRAPLDPAGLTHRDDVEKLNAAASVPWQAWDKPAAGADLNLPGRYAFDRVEKGKAAYGCTYRDEGAGTCSSHFRQGCAWSDLEDKDAEKLKSCGWATALRPGGSNNSSIAGNCDTYAALFNETGSETMFDRYATVNTPVDAVFSSELAALQVGGYRRLGGSAAEPGHCIVKGADAACFPAFEARCPQPAAAALTANPERSAKLYDDKRYKKHTDIDDNVLTSYDARADKLRLFSYVQDPSVTRTTEVVDADDGIRSLRLRTGYSIAEKCESGEQTLADAEVGAPGAGAYANRAACVSATGNPDALRDPAGAVELVKTEWQPKDPDALPAAAFGCAVDPAFVVVDARSWDEDISKRSTCGPGTALAAGNACAPVTANTRFATLSMNSGDVIMPALNDGWSVVTAPRAGQLYKSDSAADEKQRDIAPLEAGVHYHGFDNTTQYLTDALREQQAYAYSKAGGLAPQAGTACAAGAGLRQDADSGLCTLDKATVPLDAGVTWKSAGFALTADCAVTACGQGTAPSAPDGQGNVYCVPVPGWKPPRHANDAAYGVFDCAGALALDPATNEYRCRPGGGAAGVACETVTAGGAFAIRGGACGMADTHAYARLEAGGGEIGSKLYYAATLDAGSMRVDAVPGSEVAALRSGNSASGAAGRVLAASAAVCAGAADVCDVRHVRGSNTKSCSLGAVADGATYYYREDWGRLFEMLPAGYYTASYALRNGSGRGWFFEDPAARPPFLLTPRADGTHELRSAVESAYRMAYLLERVSSSGSSTLSPAYLLVAGADGKYTGFNESYQLVAFDSSENGRVVEVTFAPATQSSPAPATPTPTTAPTTPAPTTAPVDVYMRIFAYIDVVNGTRGVIYPPQGTNHYVHKASASGSPPDISTYAQGMLAADFTVRFHDRGTTAEVTVGDKGILDKRVWDIRWYENRVAFKLSAQIAGVTKYLVASKDNGVMTFATSNNDSFSAILQVVNNLQATSIAATLAPTSILKGYLQLRQYYSGGAVTPDEALFLRAKQTAGSGPATLYESQFLPYVESDKAGYEVSVFSTSGGVEITVGGVRLESGGNGTWKILDGNNNPVAVPSFSNLYTFELGGTGTQLTILSEKYRLGLALKSAQVLKATFEATAAAPSYLRVRTYVRDPLNPNIQPVLSTPAGMNLYVRVSVGMNLYVVQYTTDALPKDFAVTLLNYTTAEVDVAGVPIFTRTSPAYTNWKVERSGTGSTQTFTLSATHVSSKTTYLSAFFIGDGSISFYMHSYKPYSAVFEVVKELLPSTVSVLTWPPALAGTFGDVALVATNHGGPDTKNKWAIDNLDIPTTFTNLHVLTRAYVTAHAGDAWPVGLYSRMATSDCCSTGDGAARGMLSLNTDSTYYNDSQPLGPATIAGVVERQKQLGTSRGVPRFRTEGLVAAIYFNESLSWNEEPRSFAMSSGPGFMQFIYVNQLGVVQKLMFTNAMFDLVVAPGCQALLYSGKGNDGTSPPNSDMMGSNPFPTRPKGVTDEMFAAERAAGMFKSVHYGRNRGFDFIKIVNSRSQYSAGDAKYIQDNGETNAQKHIYPYLSS